MRGSGGSSEASQGRQFTAEATLWVVRWYLMLPISYRDLELMVKDLWAYLWRFVDRGGQTIGFRLSSQQDVAAAKRCLSKVPGQPHTVNPRIRRSRRRQVRELSRIAEQDHRPIRWLEMIAKGQIRPVGGNNIQAQSSFVAGLFQIAA